MAIASFNYGLKSNLPSTLAEGAFYITTDTGELFYGNESSGVKISDFVAVATYEDLPAAPLSNKFYYVTNDATIYKYQNGEWTPIGGGGGGGTVNAGVGLDKTGSTIKAKLVSETAFVNTATAATEVANRLYAIGVDSAGKLAVVVPWQNTEYENKAAASGGTDVSLVTTGEKYIWNNKTDNEGTVTSISASTGLTTASGSAVTESGTVKANLVSETALANAATAATEVANRVYPVALDVNGKLAVNIPWENTEYENKAAASGGTDVSLVTTGDKYNWNNKGSGTVTSVSGADGLTGSVTTTGSIKPDLKSYTQSSLTAADMGSTINRQYAVGLDSAGKLSVNVPWKNTEYESKTAASGGTDVSLVTTGEKYTWNNKGDGTVTSVSGGVGLTGSVTTTGTIKANLLDETRMTYDAQIVPEDENRIYPVMLDNSGYLAVPVPWNNTTYESKAAQSGGTAVSLVTTGEKYTWNSKTSNTGTVTSVDTGDGLVTASGSAITESGTVKANLKSYTKLTIASTAATTTSGRVYPVALDSAGYLSVNVPWENTTYESKAAVSGGTDVSLVTTGDKYNWNSKTSNTGTVTSVATGVGLTTASGSAVTSTGTLKAKLRQETNATYATNSITNTQNRQYAVVPDSAGYLSVNVPWTAGAASGTWTTTVTGASGATSVSITNPLSSTSVTVDPYCQNSAGPNGGTAPVGISEINVTSSTITLRFSALSASTTFKCLVYSNS